MTSALRWGGWSAPRPGRFTLGKGPVPIILEAGWAPGPVWTGAEDLAPTGIRSPDRPARSESLYRLSYPDPLGEQYRSLKSLRGFLHSYVTPSLLGPNIPHSTLFSNSLNMRSSLNVSDQFSHSYKTTYNKQKR